MNNHPYEILALPNGAKLIFTPCPGSKSVSLEESIKQLKQVGTSVLITLMFDKEMAANNALYLPDLCQQNQIKWFQLPIVDDEAPSEAFESKWKKYKAVILSELNNKGVIAIHCKGGTGRTGTVIALILLELGWPINTIIKAVQNVKPNALKIDKQLDYLHSRLANSASLL